MATKEDILNAAKSLVTEVREAEAPETNQASSELPPPGHGRREAMRMRQDTLQRLIEERGEQIAFGMIDENKLKIDPEIVRYYADILQVTNPQPNRQYCWVECGMRDNIPAHAHHKQMEGWRFVGPNDQECPSVPRSTEGHRRIGTAALMWIDIEHWIELKAREHASALKQRGDMTSGDRMLEVAARHGADVRIITNWNQLSPESRTLAEQRFSQRERQLRRTKDNIDRELREGTAHLHYGNQRHATL